MKNKMELAKAMKWIVIDEKGRKRLASINEIISHPIIDYSEPNEKDGDLVLPEDNNKLKREVDEHEQTRRKNRSTF